MHGYAEFESILSELPAAAALAHEALITGLLALMGVPQAEWARFHEGPLGIVEGFRLMVEATISDLPVETLQRLESIPRYTIRKGEPKITPNLESDDTPLEQFGIELELTGWTGGDVIEKLETWRSVDDTPRSFRVSPPAGA